MIIFINHFHFDNHFIDLIIILKFIFESLCYKIIDFDLLTIHTFFTKN